MKNYYFTASSLPPLEIGVRPDITFDELMFLLEVNLSSKDLDKVRVLRRYYDLQNIRNLFLDEAFQSHGNLTPQQLEEALHGFDSMPPYFYAFLEKYDSEEGRLRNFSELVSEYYNYESAHADGFLKQLLLFERNWRLVFTAMRAKALGRDLLKELQFEDPHDDLIAQLIVQKDAASFEPPEGYEDLKAYYEEYRDAPMALMKVMLAWRFNKIEEMLGVDVFTIDRILGYMAQLSALEKWFELDGKRGAEFIANTIREVL